MEAGHAHVEPHDSAGRMIGVQTAILAVLLSICTIYAHRTHTDTILFTNKSSDTWAHYQGKRIRAYQLEMNSALIKLTAPNSTETAQTLSEYSKQSEKYNQELEGIKTKAESEVTAGELAHHKASFFDLAEGILEIAMIFTSLYFLSRKKFFPMLGLLFGLAGTAVGILGLLTH